LEDKGAISDVVGTVEPKTLASGKKILTLVIFISFSYAAEILSGGQHCEARRVAERDGMG
jgi:hypothetical protein